MDVKTGEIKEFKSDDELQKAMKTGHWVELERRPNPGCKRCHGRGHIGFNKPISEYVICKCVKKRPSKEDS